MAGIHNALAGAVQQPFTFAIATSVTAINLRNEALAAGWNGSARVDAVINAGVIVTSDTTATPALTISGAFPSGVTLVNNGSIIGMGGIGGNGAGVVFGGPSSFTSATAGAPGGIALAVTTPVTITNNYIAGGAGGGGGGGAYYAVETDGKGGTYDIAYAGGGGGGGRIANASGVVNTPGGSGGTATGGEFNYPGTSGDSGTITSGGAGSAGQAGPNGGNGADYGAAGAAGMTIPTNVYVSGAAGGSAGGAVTGNSNITWIATGTRIGSIT